MWKNVRLIFVAGSTPSVSFRKSHRISRWDDRSSAPAAGALILKCAVSRCTSRPPAIWAAVWTKSRNSSWAKSGVAAEARTADRRSGFITLQTLEKLFTGSSRTPCRGGGHNGQGDGRGPRVRPGAVALLEHEEPERDRHDRFRVDADRRARRLDAGQGPGPREIGSHRTTQDQEGQRAPLSP